MCKHKDRAYEKLLFFGTGHVRWNGTLIRSASKRARDTGRHQRRKRNPRTEQHSGSTAVGRSGTMRPQ